MASSGKLKILCLHGYTQNGIMFSKKTAPVRRSVESMADFVYITGQHNIEPATFIDINERQEEPNHLSTNELAPFGWWYSPNYKPIKKDGYFVGFKESVEYVKDVMIKQGPFDGIMGFSQGACFAALLTELLQDKTCFPELITPEFKHPPFKFSIIIAGFRPDIQEPTNILLRKEKKVKTPSLHFIGKLDTLILPERMESLSEAFEDPTIFRHAGGHYLPSSKTSCKALENFISRFI